jgi:hypothetical protein
MASLLNRLLPPLLVLVHAALLVWALVGLIEWFALSVPWPIVSNALFPRWLLLVHWLAVLIASFVFLSGYALRWSDTPRAMAPAYSFMAVVCAIETFGFLTHSLRFVAMAFEYATYVLILIALHLLPGFTARFIPRSAISSAGSHPFNEVDL